MWGDTSHGGPGCRAQTFIDKGFEFRFLVDCFGTQQFQRLPSSPVIEVIPGPAERVIVVAPSIVVAGEELRGIIRAEDRFGNAAPASLGAATLSIHAVAGGRPRDAGCVMSSANGIIRWSGLRITEPGLAILAVASSTGVEMGRSNPIEVTGTAPPWRLCWGDTQGQSGATVGTGDLDSFFRHARDVAALDFVVHSGNDFQITDAHYEATRAAVRRYHDPGRFVTFMSYEWSGNTPAGGDYNILYLNEDRAPLHRSSHWQIQDGNDDGTDRYPVASLWETFHDRTDVLAIPHVGGRYTNLATVDPALCPVLEVASVHGRFNWFAEEALRQGLHIGFICATDDHSGRPGTSPPTAQPDFGHHGGLAAVYAAVNTREAVWAALRARRCYGTTGPRILLWTEIAGHPMGAECTINGTPRLRVRATGTAPLEWIEIMRDTTVIHRQMFRPAPTADARRLRVAWSGARIRGRGRATRWDGSLQLHDAVIRHVAEWGFETPGQGIVWHSEHAVQWRSTTAGDPDGVVLDIAAGPDALLRFGTEPATFELRIADIGHGRFVHDAGGLDQRVEIEWISPDPGPLTTDFEWEDTAVRPGLHAYWVRLLQCDTHAAWSSPIYTTVHS